MSRGISREIAYIACWKSSTNHQTHSIMYLKLCGKRAREAGERACWSIKEIYFYEPLCAGRCDGAKKWRSVEQLSAGGRAFEAIKFYCAWDDERNIRKWYVSAMTLTREISLPITCSSTSHQFIQVQRLLISLVAHSIRLPMGGNERKRAAETSNMTHCIHKGGSRAGIVMCHLGEQAEAFGFYFRRKCRIYIQIDFRREKF